MKKSIILLLICVNSFEVIPRNCVTAQELFVKGLLRDSFAVSLKWKAHNTLDMVGYVIERREGNGPWLIIYQTGAEETEYTDSTATSTHAQYRVRSFGLMTYSGYAEVSKRILPLNSSVTQSTHKRNKK